MAATGVPAATLAFYEDHEKPTPVIEEWEWLDWTAELSQHDFTDCVPCPGGQKCKKKYALAFSPGVPRQGTTRANDNVEYVSMLVYDFDHLERAELEALCDRISSLEAFLYSTHSHLHDGPNDCCVRLMFPLARPLKPSEFRAVRNAVMAKYGFEWRRGTALVGADPAPKDLSRLYFMPTAPIGNEVEFGRQEGALLDLDELLKGARPRPSAPRLTVVQPDGPAPVFGPPITAPLIDMEALRGLLKTYEPNHLERDDDERISRKELVRRVYAGEPLVRPDEVGARDSSCHRLAKILAFLLPTSTPEEAVVELVRKSVSSMPVYADDGENDTLDARFRTVSRSWNNGLKAHIAQETAKQALADRFKRLRQSISRREEKTEEESAEPARVAEPVDPATVAAEAKLQERMDSELIYREDNKGREVLAGFLANVITILSLHPKWYDVLRYNELTKNVELVNGPLLPFEVSPQQVVTGVKNWLQCFFEIEFREVLDGLVHVAKSNAYNPLQSYLNGLEADSTKRLDTFLERYCGASTQGIDETDIKAYVRKVSRRWLIAAVARALSPGCKMDNVLIFEGKTGIFKSTALRALGGEFFSDSKITIGEKDAMQLAGTNWIHEIAELTAFHASETETQKAFFSSPTDDFRAPYDKVPEKHPRLAVFVGSTNDDRYMNDPTGNRRYWPIECTREFLIRELKRDRDLVWAEAVQVYKAAATCLKCQAANVGIEDWFNTYAHARCDEHRWWFDSAENEELERINNHRLKADFAGGIRRYIVQLSKDRRREAYTIYEVATDMLKIPAERVASQAPAIGRALKVLGFDKERRRVGDAQVWFHITPATLLTAKKESILGIVEGGKTEEGK